MFITIFGLITGGNITHNSLKYIESNFFSKNYPVTINLCYIFQIVHYG